MRVYGLKREMRPSDAQRQALGRNVGAVRFAQNEMLRYVKENLDAGTVVSWTAFSLHTAWRERRSEAAPWFAENSKEAYQDGCTRLATALKNWNSSKGGKRSRKAGFPRLRKRGKNDSWTFTAGYVSADGRSVHVPRVGLILLAEQLEVPASGRVTALTVRERAGRWFVTARVREDYWEAPPQKAGGSTVGVDLGIGDRLATVYTSDGSSITVHNPRYFRRAEQRVIRASRNLSRKKKGSANYRKARQKLAVAHYRVACQRTDFLHKFTTNLVKTHDKIVIEDLNLVGMSQRKGYRLGKSAHDAALAEVRRQLEYKCEWYGAELAVVDRWYASSKECSGCGEKNASLTLNDRYWACPSCGTEHDRDINAAKNLLMAGSSSVAACGVDVRRGFRAVRSTVKQEVPVANAHGM